MLRSAHAIPLRRDRTADFPYIYPRDAFKEFMAKIQSVAEPDKVTTTWLFGLGFKSKPHRDFIKVLKFIDFIDSSSEPTPRYRAYKSTSQGKAVLAQAIRDGYRDFYSVYGDAERQDNEALMNVVSSVSKVGEDTRKAIVATFKTLCSLADFGAEPVNIPSGTTTVQPVVGSVAPTAVAGPAATSVSLTVNVHVELPVTEKDEIYDKIFAAMRKHIIDREK